MATRSIKEARRLTKEQRTEIARPAGQTGPSPFPLLILALLIGAIFILRLRGEEGRDAAPMAISGSGGGARTGTAGAAVLPRPPRALPESLQ